MIQVFEFYLWMARPNDENLLGLYHTIVSFIAAILNQAIFADLYAEMFFT